MTVMEEVRGSGATPEWCRQRRCAALAQVPLAAYPAALDIRLHVLALVLGALGLALLAVGLLLRSSGLLASGLVALGGEYSVWFAAQGSALDEYAPLYAATFLLVAELAYW
jgi:hypothetical protein